MFTENVYSESTTLQQVECGTDFRKNSKLKVASESFIGHCHEIFRKVMFVSGERHVPWYTWLAQKQRQQLAIILFMVLHPCGRH